MKKSLRYYIGWTFSFDSDINEPISKDNKVVGITKHTSTCVDEHIAVIQI